MCLHGVLVLWMQACGTFCVFSVAQWLQQPWIQLLPGCLGSLSDATETSPRVEEGDWVSMCDAVYTPADWRVLVELCVVPVSDLSVILSGLATEVVYRRAGPR